MTKTQKWLLLTIALLFLVALNAARIQFFYGTETGRGILASAWEFSTYNYGKLIALGVALASFGLYGAFRVWRRPLGSPIGMWDNLGYAGLVFGKATLVWAVLGMSTARDMGLLR